MQSGRGNGFNICTVVVALATLSLLANICFVNSQPIERRDLSEYTEKEKRPFCNAFTGCGRKRSATGNVEGVTESQLDNLAKFILAQRTWEELQKEADMMRSSVLHAKRQLQKWPPTLAFRKRRSPTQQNLRSQTQPNLGDLDFKSKRSEEEFEEVVDQDQ